MCCREVRLAPYSYICGYGDPTRASVLWDTLR